MHIMQHDFQITIEVVKGGFILTYPHQASKEGDDWTIEREVFVSSRKLNQKIKEVIDNVGLVQEQE